MRILFIESDRDLRDFFGLKLREEFKGVIDIVSTGREAIKLLKTERPYDVIVSDVYISKGTGVDLLRFKIANKIGGMFIFFSSRDVQVTFCERDRYLWVDKFNFQILCKEIKDSKRQTFSVWE